MLAPKLRLRVRRDIENGEVREELYFLRKITVEDYINYMDFLESYNNAYLEEDREKIEDLDIDMLCYFFNIPYSDVNNLELNAISISLAECSLLIQNKITEKITEIAKMDSKEKEPVIKEKSIFDSLDEEDEETKIEDSPFAILKKNLFYLIYENMMTAKNTNLDGVMKTDIFIFLDYIKAIKEAKNYQDTDFDGVL